MLYNPAHPANPEYRPTSAAMWQNGQLSLGGSVDSALTVPPGNNFPW